MPPRVVWTTWGVPTMIGGAVLIAGLCLAALPGWRVAWLQRLPPQITARLSAGLAATGLGVAGGMLIVWASPTVLDLFGATHFAEICRRALGLVAPAGRVGGYLALASLIGLSSGAVRNVLRIRRQLARLRVEEVVGQHRTMEGFELVVLPIEELVAYTVPGKHPQVVLSSGMSQAVGEDRVDLLIAHEAAHLRHHHTQYLGLALVVESLLGWYPGVAQAVSSLRLAVERWADEEAVGSCPTRRSQLYTALCRAALCRAEAPNPLGAFNAVETMRARIAALGVPPPSQARINHVSPLAAALGAAGVLVLALLWSGERMIVAALHLGICFV